MELESVDCFLENKTILVTGSTGFLSKVLVEKILNVQPNVKRIYLLIRAQDCDSAKQRMHSEIIEKDLFRVLREKWDKAGFESLVLGKLIPVAGDIRHENLGIKDSTLIEEMCKEIDVIVNSAATTRFSDRYDESLAINTMGTLNILKFAKKCIGLKILLHTSTAYVCGIQEGLIHEKAFKMGDTLKATSSKLDIEFENKLVNDKLKELREQGVSEKDLSLALKKMGMERAEEFGWPNTYSFTKAMGEMCLGEFNDNNLPIVVIRPTVVLSTYMDPFPGWIEGLKTIDYIIAGYCLGKDKEFYAIPKLILDVIPVDMVVNGMLVAMVAHANKPSNNEIMIYHLGSSHKNPLLFSKICIFIRQYFSKSPFINSKGKPILVHKFTVWNSFSAFKYYIMFRYRLPLKMLGLANMALCGSFQELYDSSNKMLKFAMIRAKIFKPFVEFSGIFDDHNSEELQKRSKGSLKEGSSFNFNPECIDWEDFFMNAHIPGLVKHVISKQNK